MSSVIAYSQVVQAVVPAAAWDETYFSLLSLKSHIQSLPGWQRFDLWAHDQENGSIRVLIVTNWDYPDQLRYWLERGMTPDALLRAMQPPPQQLAVDLFEEIA
ncbi:MAG TPA: hypothetical protein P5121_35010 [Caldilineaceae bacterium]|nr:hypothetical protein [Caldilineaceae bacterium]